MSDLISRQAAIDTISSIWLRWGTGDANDLKDMLMLAFQDLPSAQRWIPCSERLPDDDMLMLVNYIDNRPEAMDIWIGWHEMENVWYIDGEAHSRKYGNEVIAWQPLPEPYKESE